MEKEQSYCMFHGDAGPMAVSVDRVAAVLETESLVPLVWRPPQVVGICPYHREVVPVISLATTGNGSDADLASAVGSRAGATAFVAMAKDGGDEDPRCFVLILRTEHDAWGLRIDHLGTIISRERPELHAPRIDENGAVVVGALEREGKRYAILDAEATWRELRSAVVRWYRIINEPSFYTALPLGESTREDGTDTKE
jgi:chemotaxis signal transduction protein